MKLTPAEQKAVHFVLLLLAVSTLAQFLNRPQPLQITTEASALDGIANPAKTRKSGKSGKSAKKADDRGPPSALDPNQASAAELDRLPGIGPAVAGRIVAERRKGNFGSAVELSRVHGISRRKAIQLAPYLALPLGDTMPARRGSKSGTGAGRGSTPRESAAGHPRSNDPATQPAVAGPVNLNRATEAELQAISGIGPALARRIVEARNRNGEFHSWDAVDSVPGIGPALLTKIKAAARIGSP